MLSIFSWIFLFSEVLWRFPLIIFNIVLILEGVFPAFVYAIIYFFVIDRLHLSKQLVYGVCAAVTVVLAVVWPVLITGFMEDKKKLFDEIENRYELANRVKQAVKTDQLREFTNAELIRMNLVQDFYDVQGDRILHEFAGELTFKKTTSGDTEKVHLSFNNIPAGYICYKFYFLNNLKTFGFNETFVNGMLEKYSGKNIAPDQQEFKTRACYAGNEGVTIEFAGTLEDLKQ